MTPQEKANQLYNKYLDAIWGHLGAKECARICAQEVVEVLKISDGPSGSTYNNPGKFFWQQVLIEIDKL